MLLEPGKISRELRVDGCDARMSARIDLRLAHACEVSKRSEKKDLDAHQ